MRSWWDGGVFPNVPYVLHEPAGSSVRRGHCLRWSELLLLFQDKQGACQDRFGDAGAGLVMLGLVPSPDILPGTPHRQVLLARSG